ncbi:MAG: methyltransferase, FxLD system [Actinophytocola sp.]|uniref:methyltransferase, FxLD system n=1 Tax=Actinophytocola sp. TaxID=1872138 RepID=UPI001327EBDE|nr:methyltransferase, FxLD system [Actinophytocola sp.]MPZ80269.1 methyltransferase, FxLD system [Actinophytocola sp.]
MTMVDGSRADELREAMIGALREMGAVQSDRVAEVFRAVPRHLFTPGAPLEDAYDPRDAVHVKRDDRGVPISTVSSPQLQGSMLEQADIRPGMTAMEIGSGGVNAAMMSWLTGPEGQVTTVDIDSDVIERARRLLDAAGYARVNVVLADAENGVAEHAPYDRIIVTVGAWDIPPAWVNQLAPGGRLVVPLRMRGLTRSLELEREGDHLVSRSAMICGFVAMQGAGANRERLVPLRGTRVALRFDDGWPGERVPDMDRVLDTTRAEAWTGVTIGGTESFETLQLWLATAFPGFGKLRADADQRSVLVDDDNLWFDSAAVVGDSVAYLTTRRVEPGVSEFGAHAFGPHATDLAEAMAEQVRIWDREQRHGPGPNFGVWPLNTPDERLPEGLVINKRHHRVTISWPAATSATTGQGNQEETQGE